MKDRTGQVWATPSGIIVVVLEAPSRSPPTTSLSRRFQWRARALILDLGSHVINGLLTSARFYWVHESVGSPLEARGWEKIA